MDESLRNELRNRFAAEAAGQGRIDAEGRAEIRFRQEFDDEFRKCVNDVIKPVLKEFEEEFQANQRQAIVKDLDVDAPPGVLRICLQFPRDPKTPLPNVTYTAVPKEKKVHVDYSTIPYLECTRSFGSFGLDEITKEVVQNQVMTVVRELYYRC
ncbi:MAG: hypothetical protein JXQ29_03085 [Planctomycetes bacterium]|nr:hypothetical protein [Planctomycetota bacterium]